MALTNYVGRIIGTNFSALSIILELAQIYTLHFEGMVREPGVWLGCGLIYTTWSDKNV